MNKKHFSGAVIVCSHVASGKYPIMFAERSEPDEPPDIGWQFICDAHPHNRAEDARVWALSEILEIEPSLQPYVDHPSRNAPC